MRNVETWKQFAERIDALATLDFNYDSAIYEKNTDKLNWNVDEHRAAIAVEKPGAPEKNGPFERAKEMLLTYTFPDPRLIRAIYRPESDLLGRNMLLQARFLTLEFFFGVRVVAVIDEQRKDEAGHTNQVWGYSYRTLKGHFELGEIRFTLWKNLESGAISFHIDAYSQADRIDNPFYRVGFKLFGRSLQRSFARGSIRRLRAHANSAPRIKSHEKEKAS